MELRSQRSPLPRVVCAVLLALGALAGLAGQHAGPEHPRHLGEITVEHAALHAAAATHVEASGTRERLRCDFCAVLARAGAVVATPTTGLRAAALATAPVATTGSEHPVAAPRGAARGRAPPIA
jgi:hypothetical protein